MRYPAEPAQTHQIDQIAQCVENMLEVLVNDKEESTDFEEEIQEAVCELKAIRALDQDDLTPEVQVGCITEAEQRVPDFHNPSFGVVTQTYHHQTIEGALSCGKQDRTNEQQGTKADVLMLRFPKASISAKIKPSIEEPPVLELKPLPECLKYAFLGQDNTLPVIISSQLEQEQEWKLLQVLSECKSAFGWFIADIKGISPSICMHKIILEPEAAPVRDKQRRLNPSMMEVVKKEIIKLLDFGMIFPISDSEWVSPVQCVPKNGGITVVPAENMEQIATRVVSA